MGVPTSNTLISAYTGWQNSAPITYNSYSATQSDVRTTSASTNYIGASGGGNIFFGTSGGNAKDFVISGINTLGYVDDTLSFGLLRSSLTLTLTVEVSTDGINFTPLAYTSPDTANKWKQVKIPGIPQASNLTIRFSKNNSASYRLDDVKLIGATTTLEIAASGPLTGCSGTGVTLTSNIATGNVWSYNGATTQSIHISAPGAFSTYVTATGTNGCTINSDTLSGFFNESPAVSITSSTNVSCFGLSDGSATAVASGGTGTLLYSWNSAPLQTTATATGLIAGTYTVTVTDDNLCTASASVAITQPTEIVVIPAVTEDTICEGEIITLSSSGSNSKAHTILNSIPVNIPDSDVVGVHPVSSSISVSGLNITSFVVSNLANVKINGITHTNSADLIVRLIAPNGTYLTLANQRGTGANYINTTFTTTSTNALTSSNSPFTGTFMPDTTATAGDAFSVFNGVNPNGTWQLEVTDNLSGNTGTIDSWSMTFLNPLAFAWTSTPAGYTSSLQIPGSVTPSTLGSGTVSYNVTATNTFNGCTASASISVLIDTPPAPEATVTEPTCTVATGTITVTTPVGAGYSYSIDGLDYSNTSGVFSGLAPGSYNLTARNATGCISSITVVTVSPQPVITLDSFDPISGCPGSTVTLTGTNLLNVNSVLFNGTSATFTVMSSTEIEATVPAGATSGTISISTVDGCTATSAGSFTVTTCAGGAEVNLKFYFEGFYTGGGMMDNFGSGGCLYVAALNGHIPPGPAQTDVDTVRISLMDAATFAEVSTEIGILQTNGTVSVTFGSPVVAGTAYYIRVIHRNALETWSSGAITINAITSYDFSTSDAQAFGNNMIDIGTAFGETPLWAFFSGDISDAGSAMVGQQDDVIESQDYGDMENAVSIILQGYVTEDITGDNVVESQDYSIMENAVSAIRFSIHP